MSEPLKCPRPLRRLPLEGVKNARDLGGYPCNGGMTRWGVFLRADSPHGLTDADIEILRGVYGVDTTLDLRGEDECRRFPSRLASATGVSGHGVSLSDQLENADYEGDAPGTMAGLYMALLDKDPAAIAKAIRVLAGAQGAALFHCMVGKDRTGVVAMLLLQLMGVADADIVADYAITDIYIWELINKHRDDMAVQNIDIPRYRICSKPRSMQRTLEHLHSRYGGAERYLLQAGVTREELNAIRSKFIQPL